VEFGSGIGLCLFADRPCDRIVGRQSNVVFIAAPSKDKFHFEVDAAKEVVESANLDPVVAVHRDTLNKDVFCQKIWSAKKIEERLSSLLGVNGWRT